MAKTVNRRATLIGVGAIAGTYWGWPKLAALLRGAPETVPVPGVPGFRKVTTGQLSGGFDPLALVVSEDSPARAALRDEVRGDLWPVLHPEAQAGHVPVAAFSDYNCPYCRVLTGRLAAMAGEEGLALTWHEWPILGPTSVVAARAALAAERQGGYVAFHKRMMRGRFVADAAFLRGIAADIGIDGDQLLTDMEGPAVARRLALSDAAAGVLGFPGTPALVIGKTVVLGAIEDATLRALFAAERGA